MSSCVCKISFKSVQVCGGCCKMFRGSLFWDRVYCKRCWGVGFAKLQRGGGACDGIQCTRKAWNATKSQLAASATLTGPMSRRGSTMSPPISSTVNPTTRSPADSRGNRRLQRERILLTKANIQYQYHKTITSGRLPEGITHQAGCL